MGARTAKEPTEPELDVEKKPAEETERTESSENAVASTDLIARQVAAHNLVVAVPIIGISVFAACAVIPFVVRRRSQHAEPEGYEPCRTIIRSYHVRPGCPQALPFDAEICSEQRNAHSTRHMACVFACYVVLILLWLLGLTRHVPQLNF